MSRPGENSENMAAFQSLGRGGRVLIDASGDDTFTGNAFCVKPVTSDFTYGAGCEARRGDAPSSGDAIFPPDMDLWPIKTVVAGTGKAWVYID